MKLHCKEVRDSDRFTSHRDLYTCLTLPDDCREPRFDANVFITNQQKNLHGGSEEGKETPKKYNITAAGS